MEAFMYRLHPQWRHVQKIIRQREIGSVHLIETFFGYNNTDPNNIRNQSDTGGGALLDVGCYAVSASRFLTGLEPRRVVSLAQVDENFGTDVLFTGVLDFAPARATFTVATQTFPYQRVVVHGTSGTITLMLPFNAHADVEAEVTVTTRTGTRRIAIPPEDQYILEFEAFTRAIRNQEVPPVSPADTVNNMKVLDALSKSHQTGQWEAV
jgi:predicted dehydrogenase